MKCKDCGADANHEANGDPLCCKCFQGVVERTVNLVARMRKRLRDVAELVKSIQSSIR